MMYGDDSGLLIPQSENVGCSFFFFFFSMLLFER